MANYHVAYTYRRLCVDAAGQSREVEVSTYGACFSELRNVRDVTFVSYRAAVNPMLTMPMILDYLKFLTIMLPVKCWTYELVMGTTEATKDRVETIVYSMDCKQLTIRDYKSILLYLACFRYVDEFPDVIVAYCTRKAGAGTEDPHEMFAIFKQCHVDLAAGRIPDLKDGYGIHSVMDDYYDPIRATLPKFHHTFLTESRAHIAQYFT